MFHVPSLEVASRKVYVLIKYDRVKKETVANSHVAIMDIFAQTLT